MPPHGGARRARVVGNLLRRDKTSFPQFLCAVSCREERLTVLPSASPLAPSALPCLRTQHHQCPHCVAAGELQRGAFAVILVVDCAPTTETPTPRLLLRHRWRNTHTQTDTSPQRGITLRHTHRCIQSGSARPNAGAPSTRFPTTPRARPRMYDVRV